MTHLISVNSKAWRILGELCKRFRQNLKWRKSLRLWQSGWDYLCLFVLPPTAPHGLIQRPKIASTTRHRQDPRLLKVSAHIFHTPTLSQSILHRYTGTLVYYRCGSDRKKEMDRVVEIWMTGVWWFWLGMYLREAILEGVEFECASARDLEKFCRGCWADRLFLFQIKCRPGSPTLANTADMFLLDTVV